MDIINIIERKKNKLPLNENEINFVIVEYLKGNIPDYQMSAFLMTIWFNGMNYEETNNLTMAMSRSGKILNLNSIPGIKVDKHSTGGVGDKTTLALIPMVAAAGVPVPKISGRALGHTGGTIDKLESIKNFNTDLPIERFIENINKIKSSIISANIDISPADKKIYALRDVTGTIDSIPLIASSIMSKKIAGGADAFVLNVTVGNGAFLQNISDAISLGKIMVNIGKSNNKKTYVVISSMDQPLGYAVGNSLEVQEAIELLNNRGPSDLKELCLFLGSYMLVAGGIVKKQQDGINLLEKIIISGKALNKFIEIVKNQNGDVNQIRKPSLLPKSKYQENIYSPKRGFIKKIDARTIGQAAMSLGAGRKKKDDNIDLSVGLVLRKKIGDQVDVNDTLATIYYNNVESYNLIEENVPKAFYITDKKISKKPLILKVLS
ncbi:MAG: thymidine phosphorylase [Atribacterota bacterium]|nr:thymidine phosphorylase [Atribacterota bacterium]MDD5638009.1 thymidine phosphorylase [Atribacterota bacterium]